MDWLSWMLLGVLQGLTEFLPVSSSGHLVLAQRLLGLSLPGVLLEVTVHAGTALAVLVLFGRDLYEMTRAVLRWPFRRRPGIRGAAVVRADYARRGLVTNLLIATAVTSVVGFTFQPYFRTAFESPKVVAAMLLVTGVILFASSRLRRGRRNHSDLGPADALLIGAAQGLAILPGLSRSGLTLAVGLARNLTGASAARFSFLLSLPAIAGATLVETIGSGNLETALTLGVPVVGLVLSFVAAFIFGLMGMVWLVSLIERGRLHWFAWYCWIIGGASLMWLSLP
jgi:undecaprenyl-diphosphatase